MNPFSLDGRTALVTGSARGLGLEMARGLAQAGARCCSTAGIQTRSNKQWQGCAGTA
jgi:NAD(P)-dependent dehydrogenase (short-subunit alcohol dehydrogenase family)